MGQTVATRLSGSMLGRIDGHTNFASYDFVVTNGVTIKAGDFVYFDGSGRVTNATVAGARIVGMAEGTATGTTGSVTVTVCIDPLMRYLLKNDNIGTTFAATQIGTYFDLIGASGAQLVDTSTTGATTGQLVCLEFNPSQGPDNTYGVFKLISSFLEPYVAG